MNEWLEWESTILAPSLAQVLGGNSKNEKIKSNLVACLQKLEKALANQFLIEVSDFYIPSFLITWVILFAEKHKLC